MDLAEASKKFTELQAMQKEGRISESQFRAAVNQLQFSDRSGFWWALDPQTGGWLSWNGSAWVPAPPGQAASPSVSSVPATLPASATEDKKLMDIGTFRQISRNTSWHKRPQKWWDLFSILGGCVSAVIWFLYSGVRGNIEGFDFLTPLLMVGIPVFMVTYRAQLDDILTPLQLHRKKFPKLLLVGAGIAVPFLTAFLLYNVFFTRQYSLMHWNMLIGTFTAYAITREPVLAKGYQPAKTVSLKVPLFFILFFSVIVRIVMADDCLTDPLNARDCLRTGGYAEAIAGTASAAASTAINGPEIVRTLSQQQPPPSPPGTGEPGSEGTTPPLSPEEAAEEARRQADEARRLADWQRQNEEGWQQFVDKGREGMTQDAETGAWMSRSVAQDVAHERAETALQQDVGRRIEEMKDEILYGPHLFDPNRSDVMTRSIDQMLEQIRSGQEVSLEQYNRLRTAYGNDIMGHTIPPHQIPPSGDNWSEILTETAETSTREILTGKDADGNTSYYSMALRMILSGVTGGQSEWVYTPGSSVYDMQDYVNKGGNSVLEAWRRSAERAVIDEVTGRIVEGGMKIAGNVGGRILDNLADRYPGKADWVVKNLDDAYKFFTKERHLWGGADDAARAAAGSGDDIARAASRSGDDAGRAASGQADDAARRASDAADGTPRKTPEEIEKLKNEIRERIRKSRQQSQQGGKDLPSSFETVKTNVSPDEVLKRGGITPREQQIIRDLARDNDAIIKVRPRSERAGHLIESGRAKPKGPDLHVKTVKGDTPLADDVIQKLKDKGIKDYRTTKYNPEVEHLGYDPSTKDLVVCRKPNPLPSSKPPDMSAREWRELRQAHAQRSSEFINEQPNLEKLVGEGKGKITWDPDAGGVVYDAETGLPHTSDIDGWSVESRSNPGQPVSPQVEQRILSDPRGQTVFQHGPHAKFPVADAPTHVPAGSPPGTVSPFELDRRIDHGVIDSAASENKGLISFDGTSDTPDFVRYTGPKRFPHGLPD